MLSWVYVGANAIIYSLWYTVILTLLKPKLKLWLMIPLIPCLAVGIFYLNEALPYLSAIRSLIGPCVFIISVQLLYHGRWYIKLLLSLLDMMAMIIMELLFSIAMPMEIIAAGINSAPINFQLGIYTIYLLCFALLLSIMVFAGRRLQRRYTGTLGLREVLCFALFPISQYVLASGWYGFDYREQAGSVPWFLMAAALFSLIADLALAYTLRATARSAELRTYNAMLEKQVESQGEYYAALAAHYEDIRRMRHDIANHMVTMDILLKEGKTDEASKYLAELQSAGDYPPELDACRNSVAASFLFRQIQIMATGGIDFSLEVDIPSHIGITNVDLICALGNLLDNAVEACAAADKKQISLRAVYSAPYLSIKTGNPQPPAGTQKGRRIPELERGIGFTILNNLAEKYDGEFHSEAADGIFSVSLILKGNDAPC